MTDFSNSQVPAFMQGQSATYSQDMSDLATTPFINLVQASSHILKPSNPNYDAEARAGMLYNTDTKQLMDEIHCIPIKFVRGYSIFGGGIGAEKNFMGFFNEESAPHMLSKFDTTMWRDKFTENGMEYETAQGYHFCIMLPQADGTHLLSNIMMAKSSINTARSILRDINGSGAPQTGIRLTLNSRWEKGNGNEWLVWNLKGMDFVRNQAVYQQACEIYEQTDISAILSNMGSIPDTRPQAVGGQPAPVQVEHQPPQPAPQGYEPPRHNPVGGQPTPQQATQWQREVGQPIQPAPVGGQPAQPTQPPTYEQPAPQEAPVGGLHTDMDDEIPF